MALALLTEGMASRAALSAAALFLVGTACATASVPSDEDLAIPDRQQSKAPDAGAQTTCGGGTSICGTTCVDVQTSIDHCGACGVRCAGTSSCVGGRCVSTAPGCVSEQTLCSGKCVDLMTDSSNCGACGKACGGDAGAACTSGACPGELRVRGYIDGVSKLILVGDKVKWHVVGAAAPGLWDGHNEATILNSTAWFPVWPNAGDNRDCNCDSQLSPSVPALAKVQQAVTVKIVESRGSVTINQQPSAANQWTLEVTFSDPSNGAAWFEVVLGYLTN
jgi:hypothetical protein